MRYSSRATPCFPMPIVTPRLLIRPPQVSDAPALNAGILESFDELHRFMPWAKKRPTLRESEKYIKSCVINWVKKKNKEPYLALFVFDKNTNEFLGTAGFHHYDWQASSIEMGYWLRISCTGKGLMTEAIAAQTQYAFSVLKIKRVVITCDPDNSKSRRIPERLGYTPETLLINHRIKPDTQKPGNTIVFAKYRD